MKAINGDHVPEHTCAAGPADPSCCATCGHKIDWRIVPHKLVEQPDDDLCDRCRGCADDPIHLRWVREGRGLRILYRGRAKLGYVESDDSKWVAARGAGPISDQWDTADFKTRREAMTWVESRVTAAPTTGVT